MPDFSPLLSQLLRIRPYEVELLHPSRRPAPPLAWLLLVAGMLGLGAAGWLLQPAWERHQDLDQRTAQAQAGLSQLGGQSAAELDKARKRSSGRGGERAELGEAANLVAELNRPWQELFTQIESAANAPEAGVHLVQMSVDARFATVQLVVESREIDKLVRFSQRLSGARPIRAMNMSHHEWRDALGAHVVSAAMQGQLQGASNDVAEGAAK